MLVQEKKYYLKNSNILDEIQKSKLSYCCYDKETYDGHYDVICDGFEMITPNLLKTFFDNHPLKDSAYIRVMTDEHVKEFEEKNKINLQFFKMFPFKQFFLLKEDFEEVFEKNKENLEAIDKLNKRNHELKEEAKDHKKNIRFNNMNKKPSDTYKKAIKLGEAEIEKNISKIKLLSKEFSKAIKPKLKEVLRSHWKGETIDTGKFCVTQGKLTDGLTHMLIMLVNQYAKSGNWAGYTYIEDMKAGAIVQLYDIALKFEESRTNNAFAYLTQATSSKFIAILNNEKTQRKLKSTMLQMIGYKPTYGEVSEEEYNQGLELWEENN